MSVNKEIKLKIKIAKLENQLRFVKSRRVQRQIAIALTRLEGELEKAIALRPRPDGFLFSKPVVGKALGVESQYIESIFADGQDAIAVIGGKEHLVTKRRAVQAIAQLRRERSHSIKVVKDQRNPSIFWAENGDSRYILSLYSEYVRCNCPDYQALSEKLGNQVACKHAYALLLKVLGYGSLNEYVKAQESFSKFAQESEKEAFESLGFEPPKRLLSDEEIEDRWNTY